MRTFIKIILFLIAVSMLIAFITKPSEEECMNKAYNVVKRREYKSVPSALDPGKVNFNINILVKDRIFYKEILRYWDDGEESQTIGYGYFDRVNVN